MEKCSLEAQIQEFGQTPKLLFKSPHPSRNELTKKIDIVTRTENILLPLSPTNTNTNVKSNTNINININTSVNSNTNTNTNINANANDNNFDSQPQAEEISSTISFSSTFTSEKKKSVFGFGRRNISVPSQASKLVGGLSALKKKITGQDSSCCRWGWNFTDKNENKWIGSCPFMLHSSEITSIILSKNGSVLFSTSKDTTLKISATTDGSLKRNLRCNQALSCCVLSMDERFVFMLGSFNCIYMYSLEYGRIIDQMITQEEIDGPVSGICVVNNDRLVSSSYDGGSIKIWKFTSSSGIEKKSGPLCTMMECKESIMVLRASANGNFLAASTQNGLVYLYDLKTYELIYRINTGGTTKLVDIHFANDSQSLVCISSIVNELFQINLDGKILLKCKLLLSTHNNNHTNGADGAYGAYGAYDGEKKEDNGVEISCFISDGEYIIGGTSNGQIFIWKMDEEVMLSTFAATAIYSIPNAHESAITSLVVNSNGQQFITGGSDGSIRIWTLKKEPSSSSSSSSSRLGGLISR
jgi:factor associated with neutral sphingomyelinase activation